jgi:metal-responsive CopG/Arc/MetJ family transcriptional regulator
MLRCNMPSRSRDDVQYRCMSATRTQIYFTEELRERIDRAAASKGVSMAELVREAVDKYLGSEADPSEALASTFGAAVEAVAPSRDSWHRG